MAEWTTTYNGLVALLETYIEDTSTEFVANVQGAINRAEERIFRDLDMSIFNTLQASSTGSGNATFVKPFTQSPTLNILFNATATHCERRSLAYVQEFVATAVGQPAYFAETDTTIYWSHTTDADYSMVLTYNKRWLALSGSNQTNWCTDNVADLLLYASLVESERFLLGPERTAEFEGVYRQLLGPVRAFWRRTAQTDYEPLAPAPTPQQTR